MSLAGDVALPVQETRHPSPADYQITTWDTAAGLPDSSVLAVAQTPDGYIWCGTKAGLTRFDGTAFKVFDGHNVPELGNDQIQSLFSDHKGTLWITTRNNRLVSYQNGVFAAYTPPQRPSLDLAILNLADAEDGLWLMPKDRRSLMQFANGRFQPATNLWPGGPAFFNIRSGFNRDVWLTSGNVLAHRADGKIQNIYQARSGDLFHAPSRTGGFWISDDGRMGIYATNGWIWQGEKLSPNILTYLRGPLQWGVEDNQCRLWLASAGDGVYCFDTNGGTLHFTASNGVANNNVGFILADREDEIWLATDAGLSRIRPALFRVFNQLQGLKSERVSGVFPTKDGGLYIGTDGGGLHQLQNGEAFATNLNFPHDKITAVLVDGATNTWVATRGGGLIRSTPKGFSRVQGTGLTDEISALFEDSSQRIWAGERSLNVIPCIGPGKAGHQLAVPHSEPIIDVRCFAEDERHNIWIGTRGSGLFCWDGTNFTHFTRTNSLSSNLITTLHFDPSSQSLWIGTGGGGLARLKDGNFTTCDAGQGLWNNTICQMLDDGRGWFWFGSRRGIFRVSKKALDELMDGQCTRIHSIAYGLDDGLPTLRCSDGFQPAGCQTADGRLWFPTVNGLVYVNPDLVPVSSHPPVVQIIRVLFNGDESDAALKQTASNNAASVLELPRGVTRYEFQYTGLSLEDPQSVQFRYRLEGLEPDWIEAGTTRSATYSRLPPGNYRFVVAAANRDGIWNETGAELRFRVPPAFWQTAWFFGMCLALATGLLVTTGWMLARARARKRLAALTRANEIERERTRIARNIHDDLGTGLTHIAWLSELAVTDAGAAEKVQVHTAKIANHARHLVESLDETVWAVSPENDSLENLVQYISNYAHDGLEAAGINCRMNLPPSLPAVSLSAEMRHDLFLAVKEALNNVIKHAGARTVQLHISVQSDILTIILEDDGCGFAPLKPSESGGHGLNNMRSRLSELGGKFVCDSTPGNGVKLTFQLPLRPKTT